jgi:hypothetical protein
MENESGNVKVFVVHRFIVYLFFGIDFALMLELLVFRPGHRIDIVVWALVCSVFLFGAVQCARYRISVNDEQIQIRSWSVRSFLLRDISEVKNVPTAYGRDLILFLNNGIRFRLWGWVNKSKEHHEILMRAVGQGKTRKF